MTRPVEPVAAATRSRNRCSSVSDAFVSSSHDRVLEASLRLQQLSLKPCRVNQASKDKMYAVPNHATSNPSNKTR